MPRDSLLRCNNPRVIFSTARPLARANSYKVRAYSASPTPETARFTFCASGRARLVDLAGRAVKRAGLKRSRDGAIALELKPFELVTFEVRARPGDRLKIFLKLIVKKIDRRRNFIMVFNPSSISRAAQGS